MRVLEEMVDVWKIGSGHVSFVKVPEAVALPMTSRVVLAFVRGCRRCVEEGQRLE